MNDTVADAFRASMAPGEISIQFGRTRAGAPVAEPAVAAVQAVAMTPETARRLLSRLRESLRESERRAAITPQQVVSAMGTTPVNAALDDDGRRAAELFRLVDALGVPYQHERSFRLSHEALRANRMLLSVPRDRLGPEPAKRVMAVCAELGLPGALRKAVEEHVGGARCVHFGFEADADRPLYKIYFERRDANAEAARASAETPVLLHLAYKWDAKDPARHVTTRYHWYPSLARNQIHARLKKMYRGAPSQPLQAAAAVLDLAASRAADKDLQYLEVNEEGNNRLSFDLNAYNAGLLLKDIQAPLAQLREHFAIKPGQFQALYDQVRGRRLGHVAGGVHRDGQAFVTVYYGVESRS